MLHLLIHAQFGYLLHPSIELPSAEKTEEQLRIADVGTGTGYVNTTAIRHPQKALARLADFIPLGSGSGNSPESYLKLRSMALTFPTSSTRPKNGTDRMCHYLNSTSSNRCQKG